MPFPAQRCSEACHEGCCEAWCEAYCCAEFAAASCYGLLPWSHEKRWTDSALRRSARSVPFFAPSRPEAFVSFSVSSPTKLGAGVYTLRHWRGRPENSPQGTSHEKHTLSSDRYSEHGESVLRKVDLSSPEATACKRAAHGAGME